MSTARTHIDNKPSLQASHCEDEERSKRKQSHPLVPVIRFKEFEGNFELSMLGNELNLFNGYAFSSTDSSDKGVRWVKIADVGINKMKLDAPSFLPFEFAAKHNKFILHKGDYVVALTRPILSGKLKIAKVNEDFDGSLLNQRVGKLESKNDLEYMYCMLQQKSLISRIENRIAGTDPPNLSPNEIATLKTFIPTLPEQQKIASFLSAVDEKIQQLTKKKALLEDYKKGVMQQLFSGQLRFKDENGEDYPDWEDSVMQDVFERVKQKNKENNLNVMSISAQQGLVNQLEYFKRYVSAADVTGYYLLKKGDFAYNKSYSKGYPMGAIKRLDRYNKGVVSTLYICFRIKENDDSTFYKEFLDHGGINSELHKIAQEGARNHGLLNMSVIEFFRDIKVPRPSVEEQIVIGKFLEDLSIKIESAKKELTQTQTFKKGLLQQMFV
jgi:type I restriction enzyme S subunit